MENKQSEQNNAFKNGFQKGQEMIFLALLLKYSADQIADMLDLPTDYIFETIGLGSEREVGDRCFQKGLASARREGYADIQAFAYANAIAEAIAEEYPQGYAEGRIEIMGNLAKKLLLTMSPEEVADTLNISVEEVQWFTKRKNKEN